MMLYPSQTSINSKYDIIHCDLPLPTNINVFPFDLVAGMLFFYANEIIGIFNIVVILCIRL